MTREQSTLPIGTIIRNAQGEAYIVEETLGQGGFSSVYKVRDKRTRERVFALKELTRLGDEVQFDVTFEARVLIRLRHPSLPHVHQIFEDVAHNRHYQLMDYIEGKDLEVLRERQADKRYPLVLIILLIAPIVDAISYLHAQTPPIVHRDIKPANIIIPVESSDAVLVDFGLAKEYIEGNTTSIFRYGTPGYAAPEQYGQGTSPRTDIYGLAATIYTLLTGTVPIDAMTRSFNKQACDPLLRADVLNTTIPTTIGQVLERGLDLHAERRYATVEEFWKDFNSAAEINAIGGTDAISTVPMPAVSSQLPATRQPSTTHRRYGRKAKGRTRRPILRQALPVTCALVLLFIASAGGFFLLTPGSANKPRPISAQHHTLANYTPVDICKATSTASPNMAYPQIVPCYGGTISDIGVAHNKEAMYITGVVQNQGTILGKFQGLGLIGTFKGSVSQSGTIHFVVNIPGRADTIDFTGSIKYGGDLTGNFEALDKNGRASLDEYGFWYAQIMR